MAATKVIVVVVYTDINVMVMKNDGRSRTGETTVVVIARSVCTHSQSTHELQYSNILFFMYL